MNAHLIDWLFGWIYRPFTDRLWQLGERLRGRTDTNIWYAGDPPPTQGRPWWRLSG